MAEEITGGPEYTILSCQAHTNTALPCAFPVWLDFRLSAEIFPTYEVVCVQYTVLCHGSRVYVKKCTDRTIYHPFCSLVGLLRCPVVVSDSLIFKINLLLNFETAKFLSSIHTFVVTNTYWNIMTIIIKVIWNNFHRYLYNRKYLALFSQWKLYQTLSFSYVIAIYFIMAAYNQQYYNINKVWWEI